MPGKGITDAMFSLRMLMEKYREGQRELHCGTRESLQQGSERRAVILYEKVRNNGKVCATCTGYVRGKQNSGEVCGRNYRSFKVKVEIHQGSSLSLFLFAVIMDRLTDKVRRGPPWTMLFADNILICEEIREEMEHRLECWKLCWKKKMKINRLKTKYLCVNGGNDKKQ